MQRDPYSPSCDKRAYRNEISKQANKQATTPKSIVCVLCCVNVAKAASTIVSAHRIISIYIILLNVDTWISSQWEFFNELFAHYMSWSICIAYIHIWTRSMCDSQRLARYSLSLSIYPFSSLWTSSHSVSACISLCSQNVMCLNRFFMRFLLCW